MSRSALHSPEQIAAFLSDGESRLIAAAYRDRAHEGDLFLLPDGRARERRDWAKAHLRCMFSDCPTPDLTTVSRANQRDGFLHYRGGGKHAPESVNHRQGKAVVADWSRKLYGRDAVLVEEATDTQRSNIADVLLTHPSGRRVAFEIQYAPLTVQAWRSRHESYVRQGVIDVWLWGHTRVRKSRSAHAVAPYRLDDVQNELREGGHRVTFLNPVTAQIGIAAGRWKDKDCLTTEREFNLMVCGLGSVQMSNDGLTSPMIAMLARISRERDAELAELAELEVRRQEEHARAIAERVQHHQERVTRRLLSAATSAADSAQPALAKGRLRCQVCGLSLDPILARSGVHVGPCEWRLRGLSAPAR